jgi:hypothetical protein
VYNTDDLKQFNLHAELVIDALKNQNKALMVFFEDSMATLLGSEYTTEILTAAVFILAETDPDTCRWALRNFYDLKIHSDIRQGIVMLAVKKLIGKGFILGRDFSVTASGGIFINKYAVAALIETTSASDCIFFGEILQVVN